MSSNLTGLITDCVVYVKDTTTSELEDWSANVEEVMISAKELLGAIGGFGYTSAKHVTSKTQMSTPNNTYCAC